MTRRPARVACGSAVLLVAVAALLNGCTVSAPSLPCGSVACASQAAAGPSCAPARSALPPPGSTADAEPLARLGDGTLAQRLGRARPGARVSLPAGVLRFSDFHEGPDGQGLGVDVPNSLHGIEGSGAARTVLAMRPHTSTAAATIPTTFPNTNQLSLLRMSSPGLQVSGFTLVGTDQGHPYNGLRIQKTVAATVTDVCVLGIPGDDHQPPGETFGIADYRTVGSTYRRIRVDGRGVSAAGFGANVSRDITVVDSTFINNRFSARATFWEVDGVDLVDVRSVSNGLIGLNFERVGGPVHIVRPVLHGNGGGDLRIASDFGSAEYLIEDPVPDGRRLTIVLPRTYDGRPNLQREEDIRVLVHGRDRTARSVHFVRG